MKYVLMNKTTPVLECDIDTDNNVIDRIIRPLNIDFLPVSVGIKDDAVDMSQLRAWWKGRSIPASRNGLEQALMDMNIPSQEFLVSRGFGLSLSDQYWINPGGELDWRDVNYFDNPFSEDVGDALFGVTSDKVDLDFSSPDNTSDGWLRKRWKIIDGNRVLVKGGSGVWRQETVNEVLVSVMSKRLDMVPYVPYRLIVEDGEPYSLCANFITPDTEFVPAWQIYRTAKKPNHISVYDHYLMCCEGLGIDGMEDHLNRMLFLDHLIANTDRHMGNFGVIRDVNTLAFVGIAPIFDSGTSLWHDVDTGRLSAMRDVKSKPFRALHSDQVELVGSFDGIDLSRLHGIEDELIDTMVKSPYIDPHRAEALSRTVAGRVEVLERIIDRHGERMRRAHGSPVPSKDAYDLMHPTIYTNSHNT